jgi:hypothetical protein
VRLVHANSHADQFGGDVAARPLAVVRQKREGYFALQELGNELVGAGDKLLAPINHAVHVNQKAMPPHSFLTGGVENRLVLPLGSNRHAAGATGCESTTAGKIRASEAGTVNVARATREGLWT